MDAELADVIRSEASDSEDVHLLLRFVHPDEVPTIFAAADVVLMPYMARSALNSGVAYLALSLNRPAVLHDTLANRDLRDIFGPEWVWLCDGTAEDAIRVSLTAAAAARTETPDLQVLEFGQLAAETLRAYSDAIAIRGTRNRLTDRRLATGLQAPQHGFPSGPAQNRQQGAPMSWVPRPEHLVQDNRQPVKPRPTTVLLHVPDPIHSLKRRQRARTS
jgi:hypothetical protein